MVTVEEALNLVKKHLPQWGGLAAVTTEPMVADRDYPPFHRVMMDGIAVSYPCYQAGQRKFKIAGICPAGKPAGSLENPEECCEVMTGAPLPVGADLVIPYEHLKINGVVAEIISEQIRTRYENIHFRGSDCQQGGILLAAGEGLNGPHRGIAASVGCSQPPLRRQPRIMIVSTGDELVEVDSIPEVHQIRRSNTFALRASMQLFGYERVELSHLPDDPAAIKKHYLEHSESLDLMFYSGGVSKGKFDFLPEMWKALGVAEHFHGVAQKPGKPFWFGVDESRRVAVFGLPGNPVSSLVCLHRYFLSRKEVYVQLGEDLRLKNHLTAFVPAKLEFAKTGVLVAHPLKIKNSGEFSALAGSDGFLELSRDVVNFYKGLGVPFHPWRPL